MAREVRSRIEGNFCGYGDSAIFRLANGQVWQQSQYRYQYRYAYCPNVKIYQNGSRHFMEVAGMDEPIEVVPISIVVEGLIVSDFSGYGQGQSFKFANGQVWEQAEYKYSYHYAYRPQAVVVNGINGYELQVDGMSETIRVRRV